jgi:hypothetical protein
MQCPSVPSSVELLESRTLLSARVIDVFNPVTFTNSTGMAFDALRNRLYVPTSDSKVLRYDVATDSMLEPWVLSTATLAATSQADVTPDGSTLYVANGSGKGPDDALYRIDIGTGSTSKTLLPDLAITMEHIRDVVAAADGSVFLSYRFAVYHYDPAAGGVDYARLPDGTRLPLDQGSLSRTSDGRHILLAGSWMGRRGYLYDAATGELSPVPELATETSAFDATASISPDGSHVIDSGARVYDLPGGQPRRLPVDSPWMPVAAGFSPDGQTLFAVAESVDEDVIVELSLAPLQTRRLIPLGVDISPYGGFRSDQQVLVSPDGSRLFYNVGGSVRVYPLSFEPGGDRADLVAQTSVSLPRMVFPGTGGRFSYRVTNAGTQPVTGALMLRTVLSEDDVYDLADVRVHTEKLEDVRIAPGRSARFTRRVYLKVDTAGKTGRLLTLVDADDGVDESAENNNLSTALIPGRGKTGGVAADPTVLHVGRPGADLAVGPPQVTRPLRRGQMASVRVEVVNTGETVAGGGVVVALLDTAAPADADPIVRSKPRRAIVGRGRSKFLQLRFTVPADLAPGVYGLGVLLVFLGPGRESDADNDGGVVPVSVV